jgi:dephospho-CoA kinase
MVALRKEMNQELHMVHGNTYKEETVRLSMLCVVGMPGCGKSIFLTIASENGYHVVSMGDAVREETLRRGLPPEKHGEMAQILREEQGLDAVAHLVVEKITPDCIVDGVRGLSEIEVFTRKYPVDIVAIHASPRTRFCRVKKRQRPGDPLSWEEFTERDTRELGFGIGNVLALADYMLVNESLMEHFEKECRAFLKRRFS